MNEMNHPIRQNISLHRKRLGMTQEQLANRLGVTYQAVSKWENGQSCPDLMLMPGLADLFGITIDEIFGRSGNQVDLRSGLVLELLFDGDVRDRNGEEHHGRMVGAAYGVDRFGLAGRSLALNGRDGYVVIDPPPVLEEAYTLSVWCCYDPQTILRGWHSAIVSQDGHHEQRSIQLSTRDKRLTLHGFLHEPDLSMDASLEMLHWYHVVVIYADGQYRLYVDGEMVAERKGSYTPYPEEPLYIGRKSTEEPYFYFNGSIDDLRIYNRAIHKEEVRALYLEHGYKPVPVLASPEEAEVVPIPVLNGLDDIRMTFHKQDLQPAARWYIHYLGFKALIEEEYFYMLTLYNSPNLILECTEKPSSSESLGQEASFIFSTQREIEELRSYIEDAGASVLRVRDEGFAWFMDLTDPFGRSWMIMREK
ncbi:hypothetical protein JCM10914A_01960 [Paenibacillus sp. JCM 10914]|uniref:LamG-like jellyroll fold domain-containing protein n=1 Tax=Paenibacillus sp. JCM 10914 TaxID=1236974 RepID=UPI00055C318F|nr:LamG-like jellyroll fold domain-containing protein [Paenibacillus sp. JCM 10914]